jgi:hypothetical protein
VANSLLKQQWVGCLEEGLNRWLIFISSAIKYTQGRPRIIVFYDDFLDDGWEDTIASLGAFSAIHLKKGKDTKRSWRASLTGSCGITRLRYMIRLPTEKFPSQSNIFIAP